MSASSPTSHRLGTHAERRTRRVALVVAAISAFLVLVMGLGVRDVLPFVATLGLALAIGGVVFYWLMAPVRARSRALAQPFPPEWEKVLQRDVVFYRALPADRQERFRRELQVFLAEKRITGIKTDVDDTTRVLAAASAIIPIFGYPDWEWDQISEVLIYPGRFGEGFALEGGDRHTLGMVGTGPMERVMILSKPDLVQGFRNPGDKRNVGLHEFAHLVDKSDGQIDGVPGVGLDRNTLTPWLDLVRRKMAEIEAGESDIDPYALTNEAEFFAVVTEYLFERPELMQRKHPELYARLQAIFQQDLTRRLADLARERVRKPRKFGRNSPCPCGSGVKFKRCCLDKA